VAWQKVSSFIIAAIIQTPCDLINKTFVLRAADKEEKGGRI
jgi:hypothetical protein